ncbi:MAG: SprB repeat-containing protein [Bacteroidota bacterium]|nr:SprB repeat-containing protein [Bacteroidota bacterium]
MKYIVLIFSLFCSQILVAQPLKSWSKLFGGNGSELAHNSLVLNDSMIMSIGRTNSTSLGTKGFDDGFICVYRPDGSLKHTKTLGTAQNDQFNGVVKLTDSTVVLGGYSFGKGGDFLNNHGIADGIFVGYNAKRNTKLWEKNIGGTNTDQFFDMFYFGKGKIMGIGATKSVDRDLMSNKGDFDILISTIDEAGTIVRTRNFGASKDEFARRAALTDVGFFYVAGETVSSNEGDFLGLTNKGKKDIFLMKFNQNTSLLSTTLLGGPGDDLVADLLYFEDGSLILFATVNTTGGDVPALKGGKDIWMVKISAESKIVWSKIIGGTKDETPVQARRSLDGNILLTCTSASKDGDITGNYGGNDVVLLKLDTSGTIIWQKNYGGTAGDAAGSICLDSIGNMYLTSQSFSVNNDLNATNIQAPDFWVLKIYECVTQIADYNVEACVGDSIVINGRTYFTGQEFGIDSFSKQSYLGCDSVLNVSVTFNPNPMEVFRDSLCYDGTITINNLIFDRNKTSQTFLFENASFKGCDSILQVDLFFSSQLTINDTLIKKDNGSTNGGITINVVGGTPPYTYNWSNGAKTKDIQNVRSGNYSVIVTDSKSCVREFNFIIPSSVKTSNPQIVNHEVISLNDRIVIKTSTLLTHVSWFDIQGKLISAKESVFSMEMMRTQLPKGLIFLQIQDEQGIISSYQLDNW